MFKERLTVSILKEEANKFSMIESTTSSPILYGVTDGKRIGTYLEHKFQKFLHTKYIYDEGSSAKGLDFPSLNIDMKVTSIKQPQSSSPFKSARQKVYGLGYSLLIFVYDKFDDDVHRTGRLDILHTVFVEDYRTGDFQTTSGLINILNNDGNIDDILAFFEERRLPLDEIQAQSLAEEVFLSTPKLGYLTISNALQWRLQYGRVIQEAGFITGVQRVL